MSRWAETFAALSGGSDTVDTLRQNGEPASTVSHSVQSVTVPPDPAAAPPLPATERALTTRGEGEVERAVIVEHGGGSAPIAPHPAWWRDEYAERAAMRQYHGGYPRAEAELLAWRELENRWNLTHGERVSRELCAGCRRAIGTEEALDLIDGNRVHDRAEHQCLIRHGERWRAAASRALIATGLQSPAKEKEP